MTAPWYRTGSSTWVQATAMWYRGASSWLPVKAIWYRWLNGLGQLEWKKIHEWYTAPTEYVPNVSIGTLGLDPITINTEWTTISDPGDARYSYNVNYEWYVGGMLDSSGSVSQSTGIVTIEKAYQGGLVEVYCKVRYTNPGGNGPWTQTSSVYI